MFSQNKIYFNSIVWKHTHTQVTQEEAPFQKHLVLPAFLDPYTWSSGVMYDLGVLEDFSQWLGSLDMKERSRHMVITY